MSNMSHRARVPLLPILIILLAALVVFFPVISRLFPALTFQTELRKHPYGFNSKVWVNVRSGLYYCSDSGMYRKMQPGKAMAQREALETGYSPAERKRCP
jgi:hypothetical protein